MKNKNKLIFVYNANSGLLNFLTDTVHKTISKKTYKCNLCSITYGIINEKKEWKKFIDKLGIKSEFLHKDEFIKKYDIKNYKFPSVFINENNKIKLLISNKIINSAKNIEDLKSIVYKRIKTLIK